MIEVVSAIFLLAFLIFSLFLRNSLKRICANDLILSTRGKQRIKGKAILKKLEKSKGFRGASIIHLELKGFGTTPSFKVHTSNLKNKHFYNLIEIYSILEHLDIGTTIEVEWVKQYRFSKKYAFVSLDGVDLIGKKANSFDWFGFGMLVFVFIAMLLAAVLFYLAI